MLIVRSLLDYALLVFFISLMLFSLAVYFGCATAARAREAEDPDREDLKLITSASLTLLALVIGFDFSMAVGRYDQRRNYEEEEANAIGTEYVRVGLLPAQDADRLRPLLREYLDQRLLFYATHDQDRLVSIGIEEARIESEMWKIVETAAGAQPSNPMILVISGMNDVLNRTGYTQAAWRYRVPLGAWWTMVLLGVGCSWLIGFSAKRRRPMLLAFPLLVSIALFFIADIDSPRKGLIRVPPVNLISLSHSLHAGEHQK